MVAQTLDEEFFALVCEDEELTRAEFDAIIEANWGEPPLPSVPRPPLPSTPYLNTFRSHGQDRVPVSLPARQRSPPSWRQTPRSTSGRPFAQSNRSRGGQSA
ncbi:hypothetical protein ABZX92_23615 [Lentzea sp. NPDC006480]|uniref:hypothetical protein n=1 Tax=Lentzea sp. NPDC006480 TaxID=3157176 RepID=UPI0033A20366